MSDSRDAEYYVTTVVMFLIVFFAIFGNIITIIATYRFNTLQTRTHILIANLAVSDLFIAVLAAPIRLVQIYDSTWANKVDNCRAVISLTLFFCNASVFNLTLISIDRALSIVAPLRYNHSASQLRLVGQIAISWLIAVVISALPFVGFGWISHGNDRAVDSCRYLAVFDETYVLFVFGIAVFGPFLIMTISYVYIFRTAVSHLKKISAVELSVRRTSTGYQRTDGE